ncbi:Uncharacterized protein HZ326_16413 [Fusarium oxysporum f. sp. albedinis]|nr:Uncharacterized protein HZ326_16413 [Fusarium oxysporum f. sp. albedinis]
MWRSPIILSQVPFGISLQSTFSNTFHLHNFVDTVTDDTSRETHPTMWKYIRMPIYLRRKRTSICQTPSSMPMVASLPRCLRRALREKCPTPQLDEASILFPQDLLIVRTWSFSVTGGTDRLGNEGVNYRHSFNTCRPPLLTYMTAAPALKRKRRKMEIQRENGNKSFRSRL